MTTPLQTLNQLAGPEADRARAEALVLGLIPRSADDHAEPTRSELEDRLPRRRSARAGLPKPDVDPVVLGRIVDFHWPDHRVIVETDGWSAHGHRAAFEDDRARDAMLQAAGYVVVRFTWRQVVRRDAEGHGPARPGARLPRADRRKAEFRGVAKAG